MTCRRITIALSLLGVIAAAEPIPLPAAAAEPVIDGALDEPCWKTAPEVPVVFSTKVAGERASDTPMTARYAWDARYLYIGYDIVDRNIVALASGEVQAGRPGAQIWNPEKKVDVCEFFISTCDEPMFFWEIHHNAANQFNDVWCAAIPKDHPQADSSLFRFGIRFGFGETLADQGASTVAMAVKLKAKADGAPSTINDAADQDTGYTAEIRIPWGSLGAPLKLRDNGGWRMAGREIRIQAVLQDGDRPQRYLQSSPTYVGDWFHHAWKDWNRYQLAEAAKP